MGDSLKFISKVEIKGLWDRFDLVWELNDDVNVLSGINGIGKSTILDCVCALLLFGDIQTIIGQKISYCNVVFNDGNFIKYENRVVNESLENIEKNALTNSVYKKLLVELIDRYGDEYRNIQNIETKVRSIETGNNERFIASKHLQVDVISTFDNHLKSDDALRKLDDSQVKTELDWEIYQLQNTYLDYQINIGKIAFEIVSANNGNTQLAVANVRKNLDRFFAILDELFVATGKRLNRGKNTISFLNGTVELSPYQLSSGEKQLLVILLTVLVQDNKNAILLLDEPEISLHIDWQKKLIQYIRELNPNVQVILATHSPAIIMEGWLDKVQEVSDLITLDRKAPANAAK